ncbi:hypothetical protein BDV3_005312 [Batrachochytrium dendrobatidis]
MASKGAYKRLTKEFMLIQASPTPFIVAKPLDNNILEWHYILTGPPNSLYEVLIGYATCMRFLTLPP